MRPRLIVLAVMAMAARASADPIAFTESWEGTIDFFATGAPLAVDGPDADGTMVDLLVGPVSVDVTTADVPATADVVAAFVFWGGTIDDQMDCALSPVSIDDQILVTVPGFPFPVAVTADACGCAPGAGSYDLQACRADVTALAELFGMFGTWQVDDFAAQIANGATDNASFSLVLIYDEPDLLPPQRIALYDGVEELFMGSRTVTLGPIDVDSPAAGDLAWYVLDGDVGGAGPESVTVTGTPAGSTLTVSDAINPATNPMNHTINTTSPVQTGTLGVDIDRFDVSAALDPSDTALSMVYTSGGDKYWVVYDLVGVRVFIPVISTKSSKTWALSIDADGSGGPTPGDTIRYTITLENDGTAPASVRVEDAIPAAAASWFLVDDGGGIDASSPSQLTVVGVAVAPGGAINQVVFDIVLSASSAGAVVSNAALFDATPDGNTGFVVAPSFVVGFPPPDGGPVGPPADAAAAPDAPAMADAAAPPDARVDASLPPDARSPDGAAGGADAATGDAAAGQDAPGGSDASHAGAIDAAAFVDGEPASCNCRAASTRRTPPPPMLVAMALALLLWTRPRRRG